MQPSLLVVLDNIRSVHNTGSIFRTADGAGFEKIFCCGTTPVPVDRMGRKRPDLTKVSLGAEDFVKWEYAASTVRLLSKLKKQGYEIYAVEQAKGSVPLAKFKVRSSKFCLVMGNEVEGLSPAVLRKADMVLEIPMYGKKESLNVGVAFGVVAYALRSRS